MFIVLKPIMSEDFTRQNRKLNQKIRKGQILLKMMLQGKKGHFSLVLFQVIYFIHKTRFYASKDMTRKAQVVPAH